MIGGVLSAKKKDVMKALELGSKGLVKAIGREMPLEKGIEAFNILRKGESRGKIFLKP